jgi:DNA-binding CsgD family transcriptional regulator
MDRCLGRHNKRHGRYRYRGMIEQPHLRAVERRVLAMRDDGVHVEEIARRIDRSPAHVERVIAWTDIPRTGQRARTSPTARQRAVLRLRAEGESHAEIGERFKRSPEYIRQVEGLAHYTQGLDLLT